MITLDRAGDRPVRAGELSLALAGAELADLVAARLAALREDRIVPGASSAPPADILLRQAVASLVRQEPYETIDDWLWRRGEGLDAAYATAFEAEGLLARRRHGRLFATGERVLVDSAARRRAEDQWAAAEPVLVTLARALGIHDERTHSLPVRTDDEREAILATVGDALLELEAERQRRSIEDEAFDNIWRAP